MVSRRDQPPAGYEIVCRQTITGIFQTYSRWLYATRGRFQDGMTQPAGGFRMVSRWDQPPAGTNTRIDEMAFAEVM